MLKKIFLPSYFKDDLFLIKNEIIFKFKKRKKVNLNKKK